MQWISKKTSRGTDPRVIHVRDKDGYPPIVDEGRVGLLAVAFVFLIEPLTNSCIPQQQQRRRRDYVTPARSLMRKRVAMYVRACARSVFSDERWIDLDRPDLVVCIGRYQNELPKKIKSRGKDAHLNHEELVQTMKWKQIVSCFFFFPRWNKTQILPSPSKVHLK